MLPYELTLSAEDDLKDIARYTLKQWGKSSLCNMRGCLRDDFLKLPIGRFFRVLSLNATLKYG